MLPSTHEHFAPVTQEHWFIFLLMILGGVASYIRRFRQNSKKKFSLAELLGECVISIFVGILAYMFCEYMNFDRYLTGGLVGLASHMGTRGLFIMEIALQNWFENRFGKSEHPNG